MKYIARNKSIITGKKNLEHLFTFPNFPVFMGCVDSHDTRQDILADMSFSICPISGIIQLDKVLPLDIVYQHEHNDGVGLVWENHYKEFVRFLDKYKPMHVLEIGGGNGLVAKLYTDNKQKVTWTIVEPHPLCEQTKQIKIIKEWFDKNFHFHDTVDTIVHSHVLEHMYDPRAFLQEIYERLPIGGKHIFTFPNLYALLANKYTNGLNFEHTVFLTEYFVDYLLAQTGFKILEKEYYLDHSIFYATEKTQRHMSVWYESKYKEYKQLFTDYVEYYQKLIRDFNKRIEGLDMDIYLFGAHIFSQFLLVSGLNRDKIKGVLDNSLLKRGQRLYGTPFVVLSPEIIRGNKPVCVILKAGGYQEEIKTQLLNLNKNTLILE